MRSLLLSGACAASILLAVTSSAPAADFETAPEPAGMGWYVSVFGGWSLAKDEHLLVEYDAGALTDFFEADIDLDNGFMVGAALGVQINEWLRGEVEVSGHWHDANGSAYAYFDVPAPYIPSHDTFDLDGEEDALFVLANLWIDLPIGEVIRPYIGGGIGFGRVDVDVDAMITGGSTSYTLIDDADWGFAYQLGAGVAFDITPNMAIDVGYRYKRINNAELELDADITDFLLFGEGEEIEKDYKSHNVLVGLRFHF